MKENVEIDPITGKPVKYGIQPPKPANELGNAKPVFSELQSNYANGIFGDPTQRQASLGVNAPLYKQNQ